MGFMMTMDDRQIVNNLEKEKQLICETDTLLNFMMELDESYFERIGLMKEDTAQVTEAEFDALIKCSCTVRKQATENKR